MNNHDIETPREKIAAVVGFGVICALIIAAAIIR